MRRFFIFLIRLYQLLAAPIIGALGGRCRFHPTCSEYAVEAFENFRAHRAFCLTLKRLSKCGPWNPGGLDHPPSK
ncbi:MAG TPA: membrane protein insertion efficiency factor YidD [bacterium]|jgi:hypothetical protein|nr:membrane protein insertion efficiency factor YidD [Myxococcales bacterium]OQA62172.1 MAG: putative membrane protein insertion efficiency factor [bacterium ADurb.Bin270]HPW45729.1 membrane protein insertion efficiency factor YidD [bacterium]HQC50326.1 membrane protein insertion efficiency factor YidD [bacterium]HQG13240.1 membrane protein insertion efficiency factor YidD [bacterium]